jgi:hypothetical protein
MYEIPQQLEYKEKIVFGLTFEQIAYALVFFPVAFIILFRLDLNLYVRVFLTLIPSSLAAGFMFFNLKEYLKDCIAWYKHRLINSQKGIQRLIGIEQIKDNIIHTNNKKLAVLKVSSIDFQLKAKEEKETITLAFQKFLNSLDFPI